MGLLLILPLLASGYLVCILDRVVFFKLHRYEGQLLYFLVAYQGLKCFALATLIVGVFSLVGSHHWQGGCLPATQTCIPSFSTDFLAAGGRLLVNFGLADKPKAQLYFFWLLVGVLTLLAPWGVARISSAYLSWKYRLNEKVAKNANEHPVERKLEEDASLAQGAVADASGGVLGGGGVEIPSSRSTAHNGDNSPSFLDALLVRESVQHLPISRALVESWMEKIPVLITMSDRKVYVGIIHSVGSVSEVSGTLEHFGIWPAASGYRDKDSLVVKYTHKYPTPNPGATNAFPPLFLRQESIASITHYDEAYKNLIEEKAEEKAVEWWIPDTGHVWSGRGRKPKAFVEWEKTDAYKEWKAQHPNQKFPKFTG